MKKFDPKATPFTFAARLARSAGAALGTLLPSGQSREDTVISVMRRIRRAGTIVSAGTVALLLGGLVLPSVSLAQDNLQFELTPSSQQLADCMPDATLVVTVKPASDKKGSDIFDIRAHNLPPNRDFPIFLLQQAGAPFGAAEYIGDVSTNEKGNGHNTLKLIVGEAFSSTIVNGARVRVDLNEIGVWFADPGDDDFCLGNGAGATTPFDGDGVAGVQAFNSAKTDPLPAP